MMADMRNALVRWSELGRAGPPAASWSSSPASELPIMTVPLSRSSAKHVMCVADGKSLSGTASNMAPDTPSMAQKPPSAKAAHILPCESGKSSLMRIEGRLALTMAVLTVSTSSVKLSNTDIPRLSLPAQISLLLPLSGVNSIIDVVCSPEIVLNFPSKGLNVCNPPVVPIQSTPWLSSSMARASLPAMRPLPSGWNVLKVLPSK